MKLECPWQLVKRPNFTNIEIVINHHIILCLLVRNEYGDGDNELMISVVFSPNPIITTPILCKYLDRERDGAIWSEGPPTCFIMIAMMMIFL